MKINKTTFNQIVFLFFLISSSVFSQTGKIAGRVLDKNTGEALPFVNMVIVGTSQGAASDIDGYYSILNLRPGTYSLKASAIGYTSVTIENLKVSIGLTTKADFNLSETSVSLGQEVVVVAKKPLVTKDLTASTAIIGGDEIASLPVTEFQQVLQLKAGIVGGNVRGGRKGEVLYQIDGVPVTDAYDGSTVVDVDKNAIQELQFISGAFNAEYGRALSGVVNLATKDGGNQFKGSVTSYIGGHYSNRTEIFRNIDKFKPTSIRDIEGNLSGPIINNKLYFYVNSRYNYFDGWFYGKKLYNPWDITTNISPTLPLDKRYNIQQTGDGSIVPMNWSEKVYLHGKLTYLPFTGFKVTLTYINDRLRFKNYDGGARFDFNPDGDYKKFSWGNTNILGITHTLGAHTFYQANFSYFFKKYRQYAYANLDNPLWTNVRLLDQQPKEVPSFKTGGTRNDMFKRITNDYGFKFDLTSQITRVHEIKLGVNLNQTQVSVDNFNLLQWIDKNNNGKFDPGEDGIDDPQITKNPFVRVRIPDPNNPNENLSIHNYNHKPIELSAYLQDKLELNNFIVNVGVRVDYFEPDGQILTDPSDPDIYRPRRPKNIAETISQRRTHWYKDATSKFQVSPRLGVAFPITDRAVIHFSYGHFFQVPNYELLYQNPEYKFGFGTDNLGVAGNPDLNPEQTISGEIGIQQSFTDQLGVDITAYFRDIRNLAGTRADEIRLFGGAGKYSQFVNSDFGFVKGLIVSVNKRFSNHWSATLDYTFQSAKGNASDPEATRNALASGELPEIQLVSLNWDQTHTINATFNYTYNNWGFSFIAQYGSGFPYTPTQSINLSKLLNNSELKPSTYNVDLRAFYDLMLFKDYKLSLFLRVNNIFDIKNESNVYGDSGTADFTLDEFLRKQQNLPTLVNSIDAFYRNPTFYFEPRRIEMGASFYF